MIECFGIILRIIVLDLLIISKLMLEELINDKDCEGNPN